MKMVVCLLLLNSDDNNNRASKVCFDGAHTKLIILHFFVVIERRRLHRLLTHSVSTYLVGCGILCPFANSRQTSLKRERKGAKGQIQRAKYP